MARALQKWKLTGLSSYCLLLFSRHKFCVTLYSEFLYLFDTGGAVRAQKKTNYFCDQIVVFAALHRVGEIFAVGT